jgi:serine/threonine-protein kinase
MVAGAGGAGGLHPALAVLALVLVLLGIAAVPFMFQATRSAGWVALALPPEVLTAKAREIVQQAGYVDAPVDSAYGFSFDEDYFEHAEGQDPAVRWTDLATVRPTPIYFWYRQSPRYLTPTDLFGGDGPFPTASPDDPPPVVSGMVGVRLDPEGRLLRFEAVPPEVDDSAESGAEPQWSALFERAGIDLGAFMPTRPTWNALGGTDLRRAWEGAFPDGSRTPVRVEAGAYRGRPTLFQIVTPWTKPARMVSRPWRPGEKALAIIFGLVVVPSLLVGGLLLARRNLRRGRGDRRGAFRVGLVVFVCGMLAWVFGGDHEPTFAELGLLAHAVMWNLSVAAIIWLLYIALEPYARRVWPEGLVSWSRLLQGRWRDPLVGRDILVGGLTDLTTSALGTLRHLLPIWIGLPLPHSTSADLFGLEGLRHSISNVFLAVQGPLLTTVVTLFLLLMLRLPLRRTWAAATALVVLMSLPRILSATNPEIDVPIALLAAGLEIFVLVRFGMLALLSGYVFGSVLWSAAYTWDLSAWYMGRALLHASLVAALALYAFRISLAGRPLLRGDLFDDEPTRKAGAQPA